MPKIAGGVVADGTYELTAITYYDVRDGDGGIIGSGGYAVDTRQTMRITGNEIDSVSGSADSTTDPLSWESATLKTAGTTFRETPTCVSSGTLDTTTISAAYTATPNQILTFYPPQDMGGELGMSGEGVWTWTKKQ